MSTSIVNNVQVERADDGVVTLRIEVTPNAVRTARERVIKDYARRLRVPGFRPGHIPPNIVRRQVGDEAITQTMSDQIVPTAYQEALQQSEVQPLERAEVDELTFDAFNGEAPLQFTARVIARPQMELDELKGIAVTQPAVSVSEEDIDNGIEALRSERATLRNVEGRGAIEGDILNAELAVYIDDQPRAEEPARLRSFVLGDSGFVPRIDEDLIGSTLDEERRFNVTYPSDFKDADLAGQIAEFRVKVTSIKERVLPEVDDEFATMLGVENIAGLRERMIQFIQQSRKREVREGVRNELIQAATERAHFEVPSKLIENRTEARIHNLEHELEHRQSNLEDYLESMSQTREEFDANVRQEIEAELRRELVLDQIADREKLQVSGDEIENQYRAMAAALQQPIERLVEEIEVVSVRASILQRKAVDWLFENAVVTGEDGLPIADEDEDVPEEAAIVPEEVGDDETDPLIAAEMPSETLTETSLTETSSETPGAA